MANTRNRHTVARLLHSVVFVAVFFAACGDSPLNKHGNSPVDSRDPEVLLETAHEAHDYNHLLQLADSLGRAGRISEAQAYYWLGYASNGITRNRVAEFYWKKGLAAVHNFADPNEMRTYTKTASRLANMLNMKGDYEQSLQMAMAASKRIEDAKADTTSDYANLLIFLGCCQSRFGQSSVSSNYNRAYLKHLENIQRNHTDEAYKNAIAGLINIVYYSISSHEFEEALMWLDRLGALLTEYEHQPYAKPAYIDKQRARYHIYRASALEGLGRHREAAEAYDAHLTTDFSRTIDGRFTAGNYLIAAGRWDEAADNYRDLDAMVDQFHMEVTLDNIQNIFLKKYYANLGAQRMDSLVVIGRMICDSLDAAITRDRVSDAAELAVIYDTQQKEAQIAEQEAHQTRLRQYNIILILAFVLIVVAIITVNSYIHGRHVEEKNKLLQLANARAEESSRMKTNFIQQISHEIRTPLNILSGFTQILTTPDMELDDDTKRDANQQIMENTGRITSLVNKMLELSDANSNTVIDLTNDVPAIVIAAQAVDASRIANQPHLDFDMHIAPEAEEAMLHTNTKSATRALSLLLDNASKFTKPAEAAVANAAANTSSAAPQSDAARPKATLSVDVLDAKVRFIVEDTGIGIPASEAERIFDEFVQLNDYYDGTGIGLTVARSLVRRMGGDIVLDTDYTSGARFVMSLPAPI